MMLTTDAPMIMGGSRVTSKFDRKSASRAALPAIWPDTTAAAQTAANAATRDGSPFSWPASLRVCSCSKI